MINHTTSTNLPINSLTIKLCLLFIIFSSSISFAQPIQFSKDSIPTANKNVVFSINFESELNKEELFKKTRDYFNDQLNPYSGAFITNNKDSTICKITDYLLIDSSFLSIYAMYMTYNIHITYKNGYCNMIIKDITYMEKEHFEAQEKSQQKLNMPIYSGKDIMIDKNYSWLLKKNASIKITNATLDRFNNIIERLYLAYTTSQ